MEREGKAIWRLEMEDHLEMEGLLEISECIGDTGGTHMKDKNENNFSGMTDEEDG